MRCAVAIFIIISLWGVNALANSKPFELWAEDALVKVLREAKPEDKACREIRIEAVRNEYESAQLIATAAEKIDSLTVEIEKLEGPSRIVPRIAANFVGYVPVRRGTGSTPVEKLVANAPFDAPDPLLDVQRTSVQAGKSQPIWLTIFVPKDTAPGRYRGTIRVIGDGAAASAPIEIEVHPFILPDDRTLFLTNWFSPHNIASGHGLKIWSDGHWKMLEAYARLMAEHRQNAVITPIMELIKAREDSKGDLIFDFSAFDRWVELFIKAGVIGIIEGGHLGGRSEWTAPDFEAIWCTILAQDGSVKENPRVKVTSEEERRFLSEFLPALQNHLAEKGWLENYIQHLCDEPIAENAESYKKLASYVREFAPKLRIIDACMVSSLTSYIDIWVPQPEHFEKELTFFKERQKAGDEVWFYTCLAPKGGYMNRFLDYPLLSVRLLHWGNFKYGLTGYLHWGFNYWQGDPFTETEPAWTGDSHLPPGDSHIVYPGRRGPLSSIRLEALRDGVEDYEMLKILAASDPKLAREICDSAVRSFSDYTRDAAEFREIRKQLIEALDRTAQR